MENKQIVKEHVEGQPLPIENRVGAPSPCQLTLIGFTVQKDAFNVTVGDLFGNTNELVYIPLDSAMYSGSRVGIGVLVGGVLGGITASSANQQALESARSIAAIKREKDFGKSLEERIREHDGLVIPRKSIVSISVNKRFSQVIEIVHQDGTLALSKEDAVNAYRKLESWRKGNLFGEKDTQGINLGLPSAERILEWLVDGSICSNAPEEMLEAILLQPAYLEVMLKQFDRLKNPQKAAVLNTVRTLTEGWVNTFSHHLGGLRAKGKSNQRWAMIVLILSIISAIIFFSFNYLQPEAANEFPLLCTGYGIYGLLFSIPWLIYAIVQNRKMRGLHAIIAASAPETPEISK